MNETKSSPGPWTAWFGDNEIEDARGDCIADVFGWTEDGKASKEVIDANLALIREAPAMRKLLAECAEMLDICIGEMGDGDLTETRELLARVHDQLAACERLES